MHFTTGTFALAFVGAASAHTHMFSVSVNGEDQGDGRNTYIRSPPNNDPVKDLTSPDLVCNVNGGTPVSDFVSAAAGDKLTLSWYHNEPNDETIDPSHKGPIITYITEYTDSDGSDAGWTKIAQDGLDGDEWAVDKLIAAGGMVDVTLPATLKAGKYLLRQEIIGLHEADVLFSEDNARGAQFYPSCVQVDVSGSGTMVPNQGFNFNTGYTDETPGIVYNIYEDDEDDENGEDGEDGEEKTVKARADVYPLPGPDVWTEAGANSSFATLRIKGRRVVRV